MIIKAKHKSGDPTFSRFLNEPGTGFNDFNRDGQESIGFNMIMSYIFPESVYVRWIKEILQYKMTSAYISQSFENAES